MSGTDQSGSGPLVKNLTIGEVAKQMKVCERTVLSWRKMGLRAVKIGRKVWIKPEDLQAFFDSHRTAAEGA